jgi:hypothetical protein
MHNTDYYYPESVYQGNNRILSVEEKHMFSSDFCLEKETARVLKDLEFHLHTLQKPQSHKSKNALCEEALEMLIDLRRFYTDDDYVFSEEY